MVRELDNQDAVFRNQTDQRIDVKCGQSEKRKEQRAGKCERYGAHQNDERIAKTFELSRQNQVNQDAREQEGSKKLASLDPQLSRFARVVNRKSLRQQCLGLLLKVAQCLVQRHIGRNYALNRDSVQLLEFIQLPGLRRGLQRGKRGQRNQLVVGAGYIDLLQLLGC